MLTKTKLEKTLKSNPQLILRLETLKLAEKLNPDFRTPHIVGGYLRDIFLDEEPKDCDVVFKGIQLNQPGILESVREAEEKLSIDPYPNWEFENASATGVSKDFFEDTIGKYSHHTDYLTLMLMNTTGELFLGDKKTLKDLENRSYDLRFTGIEIWSNHRRKDKSYTYSLVSDLIRATYLGSRLQLQHSEITQFLLSHFDQFFNELSKDDRKRIQAFWLKKTNGHPSYNKMLDFYNIRSLKIFKG